MDEIRKGIMMDKALMQAGVALLLRGMGVNLQDPNFIDTPQRVADMFEELLSPRQNSWTVFDEKHASMVLLRRHDVVGICPHHLLPITMQVWLAYIPAGKVLGLSKLARCVESQLTSPIMQESLTDAIVDDLMQRISPKGAACIIAGKHGCMTVRGIRTHGDVITSALRGVFLTDPSAKAEFLQLVGPI